MVPRRTPGCGPTFTIHAWSLRPVSRSESAPVSVATAVIGFLPCGGWPRSLVMPDQMDVCPLARGVRLPVGSPPLHPMTGRRLLRPSSHARTPLGLPSGSRALAGDVRGSHGPSQSPPHGGGARAPPGACGAHDKAWESPCPRDTALVAPAFQHLWLVVCDDVYRAFTWVRHPLQPRPSPSRCGQRPRPLTVSTPVC